VISKDSLKRKSEASIARSRNEQRALEATKRKAAKERKLFSFLFVIAFVLNAGIAYALYDVLVIKKNIEQLKAAALTQANERQTIVADYFRKQAIFFNALASKPELLAHMKDIAIHPELRTQYEQQWLDKIPHARKVRLILPETAQLDRDGEFPIRYAELDFIRRAEAKQTVSPEWVSFNKQQVIHFIRPLLEKAPPSSENTTAVADTLLGTIMIVLDAKELIMAFSNSDQTLGEYLLLQQFATGSAQTIIQLGTATSDENSKIKSAQVAVPDTYLSVKFTASDHLISSIKNFPTLWSTLVGLIATISLAIVLFLLRLLLPKEKGIPIGDSIIVLPKKTTKTNSATSNGSATTETPSNPLFQTQDILDIAVIQEDEDILGLDESLNKKTTAKSRVQLDQNLMPQQVFRSYDIRGLADSQITPEFALLIGQAIGSEALDHGEHSLIVARDGRTHSADLCVALIKGILKSGCNVIDIGLVPTPLLYFASFHFDDCKSGVMITASHNPKEYNGFKIVINNQALADEAVFDLRSRVLDNRLHNGAGQQSIREIIPAYIDRIFSDVALAGNVKVVIDSGNAVAGLVAPQLFEQLGCEVVSLFCDLDGEFPHHDPDPTDEKNLQDLIAKVKETDADIGVAFDGDGDRLVIVTPQGHIIWPDRLMMLFAKDILARNPGADVIFDVKSSRQLSQVISSYGGRPIMWKTGHSPMKAKMEETQALLGGEYSGHIFIKDRWYGFDDGIYAMARLLEIITLRDQKIDAIFAGFPQLFSTNEIKIPVSDETKFTFIKKLTETGDFTGGTLNSLDGLRVDFPKGWGLVRASNTSPALTLRFEAESTEELQKLQQLFKRELLKIDKSLSFSI
jgi:phosphomannomutase / phosphoglucomutase